MCASCVPPDPYLSLRREDSVGFASMERYAFSTISNITTKFIYKDLSVESVFISVHCRHTCDIFSIVSPRLLKFSGSMSLLLMQEIILGQSDAQTLVEPRFMRAIYYRMTVFDYSHVKLFSPPNVRTAVTSRDAYWFCPRRASGSEKRFSSKSIITKPN